MPPASGNSAAFSVLTIFVFLGSRGYDILQFRVLVEQNLQFQSQKCTPKFYLDSCKNAWLFSEDGTLQSHICLSVSTLLDEIS